MPVFTSVTYYSMLESEENGIEELYICVFSVWIKLIYIYIKWGGIQLKKPHLLQDGVVKIGFTICLSQRLFFSI